MVCIPKIHILTWHLGVYKRTVALHKFVKKCLLIKKLNSYNKGKQKVYQYMCINHIYTIVNYAQQNGIMDPHIDKME